MRFFLLYILLLIFSIQSFFSQFAFGQNSAGDPAESGISREAGSKTIYLGAGTTNGIRIGTLYYLDKSIPAEISFGYLRLGIKKDTTRGTTDLKMDAFSASAGINYFTHPENEISGCFSILCSYIWPLEKIAHIDQKRWALTAAFGADITVIQSLSSFFRIGPTIHFLSKSESGGTQLFMHFDAGIGWTF